jgi:hypothetical protein
VRFLLTGAWVQRLIRSEKHLREFEFSSQDFLVKWITVLRQVCKLKQPWRAGARTRRRQISAPTETCFDPIIGRADIYVSLVRAPPRQASAERSAATTQERAAESCEPYVIFLEPVAGPFATG